MRFAFAATGLIFAAAAALMIYTGGHVAGALMAISAAGMSQASMMAARTAELKRATKRIKDRQ